MPVAFVKVKFCKVEEPSERMFAKVPVPVEVRLPPFAEEKYTLVDVELVVVRVYPGEVLQSRRTGD